MRYIYLFLLFPFATYAQNLETVVQHGHELAVVTAAISPDSNHIATGSKDKSIKLWEKSTGREVRSFPGHLATVTSVAFTSDGHFLISGSNDKSIRIWKLSDGKEVGVIETTDIVTDIVIDPGMKFFVVAGYGNSGYGDSATVYSFPERKVIRKIRSNADKGLGSGVDLSISPDGKLLGLGEDNREANFYQTSDWKQVGKIAYPEGFCGGCGTRTEFGPDSKFVYVISNNGSLNKYDVSGFKSVRSYSKDSGTRGVFVIERHKLG